MSSKARLSLSTLNQWTLDFEGNYRRIAESIRLAHDQGSRYRLGPELEICGYGCEDHFYEGDTELHSWEVLAKLLEMDESSEMICDVGMPVTHNNTRYNCRIIFLNKKILLIRPKLACCNQGNYRELRWFTPWLQRKTLHEFRLPKIISQITGQKVAPIGDGILQLNDTCVGSEICEELWTCESTHVEQSLHGVEVFTNASASHFNLRKINQRLELAQTATAKVGGVYMYCNLIGCDGARMYYDGASTVCCNGEVLAASEQFSLREVDVITVTVDLDEVRAYRGENSSRALSSAKSASHPYPRVDVDFDLCLPRAEALRHTAEPTVPSLPVIHSAEEEIELGPACWLWDYLRRSGMSGFFLPLSGGIDSSATACIVYSMCCLVVKEIEGGNKQILADVRRIVRDDDFQVETAEQLCNRIFTTCYMSTQNSSSETRKRAEALAGRIGSCHMSAGIDGVVTAFLAVFTSLTGFVPRFKARGGTRAENLALQNIQARTRMVLSYLMAQLLQWTRGRDGSLLVLASANVDECLRGYYTKYDCSSADINPIGGINKSDLKSFVAHFIQKHAVVQLVSIIDAPPTAELEPLVEGKIAQSDEADMGMSYGELTAYGKLRKLAKCAPYSMFRKLLVMWNGVCTPKQVGEKVMHFFRSYAINRHKTTTLTPSLHAENYAPDDNRFDLRPFLYPNWSWQFRRINDDVTELSEMGKNI